MNNGTGFVLRRFNADLSRGVCACLKPKKANGGERTEVFDSELEKMNASLIIENQQLQHENKQLNALLKEYEGTLEMVMTKFRTQAVRRNFVLHEKVLTKCISTACEPAT